MNIRVLLVHTERIARRIALAEMVVIVIMSQDTASVFQDGWVKIVQSLVNLADLAWVAASIVSVLMAENAGETMEYVDVSLAGLELNVLKSAQKATTEIIA